MLRRVLRPFVRVLGFVNRVLGTAFSRAMGLVCALGAAFGLHTAVSAFEGGSWAGALLFGVFGLFMAVVAVHLLRGTHRLSDFDFD